MAQPARPTHTEALPDLLRAEGARPAAAPPDQECPAPTTKDEALVDALYDLAVNKKHSASARVAAARLILEYGVGRPAPAQVSVAADALLKMYVVISPDDWPSR